MLTRELPGDTPIVWHGNAYGYLYEIESHQVRVETSQGGKRDEVPAGTLVVSFEREEEEPE